MTQPNASEPLHRPAWLDDVPINRCECGARWSDEHQRATTQPNASEPLREALERELRRVLGGMNITTFAETPGVAATMARRFDLAALATPSEPTLPLGEPAMHAHDGLGSHRAETHHRPEDFR